MLPWLNTNLRKYLRAAIDSPHYWLAYTCLNGAASHPLNVDWELTFRCNLSCQMCPQELFKSQTGKRRASSEERELSIEEMKVVVDDLAKMKVKVITLTGGEPFLHPNALEIAQYIKQKGIACNILTNGGVLTEEIAAQIVRAKVDALTFSLDGSRDVHDLIRGSKGSFDKLSRAVDLIQKYKLSEKSQFPSLAFNCTISALNQNSFSDVLKVANKLCVPTVNFGYLFFTTDQAISATNKIVNLQGVKEENQVLPDNLKKVDTKIIKQQIALSYEQAEKYKLRINFVPPIEGDEIDKYFNDNDYAYCSKCFFPWYASRINPYGAVYPCSIDYCIGNVRENPFPRLWNNQAYRNFRQQLKQQRLFPKCNKCCMLNNKFWDMLPPVT